jgi:hypothetical protein
MYFKESASEINFKTNFTGLLAVVISGLLVLIFGILPGTLLSVITSALSY